MLHEDFDPDPDQHKAAERGEYAVGTSLDGEHPHEPGDGSIKREGEELPRPFHPCAGPRQQPHQRGHKGQQQIGQCEADAQREEDADSLRGRLREGVAERAPISNV